LQKIGQLSRSCLIKHDEIIFLIYFSYYLG